MIILVISAVRNVVNSALRGSEKRIILLVEYHIPQIWISYDQTFYRRRASGNEIQASGLRRQNWKFQRPEMKFKRSDMKFQRADPKFEKP